MSQLKNRSLLLYSIIQSWNGKECVRIVNWNSMHFTPSHILLHARCMNWNFFSKEFALFKSNYILNALNIFVILWYISLSFNDNDELPACIEVENFQSVDGSSFQRHFSFKFAVIFFGWWNVSANIGTLFTLNQFNHLVYIPTFNRIFSFEITCRLKTRWIINSFDHILLLCKYAFINIEAFLEIHHNA